jgi:hypothetical protein
MPRHDPMVRLHHMLDHAQEAVEMVRNRCRTDLDTDRHCQLNDKTPDKLVKYLTVNMLNP